MQRHLHLLPFPDESCYSLRCFGSLFDHFENDSPFFLNIKKGCVTSLSQRPSEAKVFDLPGGILVPRFVNAHTHLELSGFAGPISWNGSFPDWIADVMKHRRSDDYSLESAVTAGEKELHDTGTGAVYDIVQPQDNVARGGNTWRFLELIAWNASQAEAKLMFADNFLKHNRNVGLSPHAPYTICPQLLHGAIRLSKIHKAPLAVHLTETRDEIRLLHEHDGPLFEMMRQADQDYEPEKTLLGDRPLHYLEPLAQADQCLIIHGNYLDDEELRFLAQNKNMTVVFCPVPHKYFEHQAYPIRRMLDLDIAVALGTDSRASWPDIGPLSMLETVNTLLSNYPEVEKKEALSMATTCGYHATGLSCPFPCEGASVKGFNVIQWL